VFPADLIGRGEGGREQGEKVVFTGKLGFAREKLHKKK